MSVIDQLLSNNVAFAASPEKRDLPSAPAKRIAIVACMDARLDPYEVLGLTIGDAHVIRNAGGVVSDDALRSLVISHWLLGTREAFVIAHSDCGMLTFQNADLQGKLADEAGADASGIDFLPFSDLDESVRASVERVRSSELLPDSFAASGYVYDVGSGALREVA